MISILISLNLHVWIFINDELLNTPRCNTVKKSLPLIVSKFDEIGVPITVTKVVCDKKFLRSPPRDTRRMYDKVRKYVWKRTKDKTAIGHAVLPASTNIIDFSGWGFVKGITTNDDRRVSASFNNHYKGMLTRGFERTTMHEIAHTLGAPHAEEPCNIMNYRYKCPSEDLHRWAAETVYSIRTTRDYYDEQNRSSGVTRHILINNGVGPVPLLGWRTGELYHSNYNPVLGYESSSSIWDGISNGILSESLLR